YTKDSQPLPLDSPIHFLQPGDSVLVRTWKDEPLQEKWKGPYTVLLVSHTEAKIEGHKNWIHHSRLKWVDPVTDIAMASRGPHPALLLPLILLAASLAQLREGTSYSQFLNQHIEFPKSSASSDQISCELMMQRQGLTRPFGITGDIFI
ncbi:unnamed protein product, partial [Caretta caretta]